MAKIQTKLEDLLTFDNLFQAYIQASKSKHHRRNVDRFEQNLYANLVQLLQELKDGTYQPRSCYKFEIYCTAGQKRRLISAPQFRDCVVQHLIYQNLYWQFDKKFIFDSYGCRKGKGPQRAAKRVYNFVQQHEPADYYCRLDMRKYYYSIDHNILREILVHDIEDQSLIELMMKFCTNPTGVGLEVGNVISQFFGMIYLNRLDHYCKRVLKIKHYIRYVDDIVIITNSKQQAQLIKQTVEQYIKSVLNMSLSKCKIQPIKHGINFSGMKTFPHYSVIRKRSLRNLNRAIKANRWNSVQSILSHCIISNSYHRCLLKIPFNHVLNLPKRYRLDHFDAYYHKEE